MLIEIHAIQNHSPANLNRDDLGAPKTCYFGGVLRSRISSQCIKRSIRMSKEFEKLLGGIRTRRLAKLIADKVAGNAEVKKRAAKILKGCGIAPKDDDTSDMIVYTTQEAVNEMASLLQNDGKKTDKELQEAFGKLISERTIVPDMALGGRMLETGVLKDTTVEAALQVAHAISTHEARPEVDYFVAADDVPGEDAGGAHIGEALFASSCFYKYFSIDWEQLVKNLKGNKELAAHTVGAFIRGAAQSNPSGKQNSCASHCRPDGILVEIRDSSPISYANAFASPVPSKGERDMVSQSIAQMGQYIHDLDTGYGKPKMRFWFSPNLRYPLTAQISKDENGKKKSEVTALAENNIEALDKLICDVLAGDPIKCDWIAVQKVVVNQGEA